jgi:hypothetical protein
MRSGNLGATAQNGIGQSPSWGNALSGLGAGLFGLFGAQNPAQSAMPYEQQSLNQLPAYYQPYMNSGQTALGNVGNTASQLMQNPGEMLNQIGSNFHSSPGFNFAMRQAMMGGNQSAAAGGMAGSPEAQQLNQQMAGNLANQNYYNYTNQAQGLLGQGLGSEQGLAGLGFGAASGLGQNISDIMNNQAMMQYAGQMGQNQTQGSGLGSLLGGIGSIGSLFGL